MSKYIGWIYCTFKFLLLASQTYFFFWYKLLEEVLRSTDGMFIYGDTLSYTMEFKNNFIIDILHSRVIASILCIYNVIGISLM